MTLPEKFKERMREYLGGEYESFIASYDRDVYHALRVNTLKITPSEFAALFPHTNGAVPWCGEGFYYDGGFGRHPFHRAGLFYSQEPSAMISSELLDVKPGEVILDLCAAPGGKATQTAAKLNGSGLLVANEVVRSRSAVLRENIERMGIRNCVVTNMSPEKMEGEFPLFFDKILVDAPCSGEGMFLREPEAVRAWSAEHVKSCAERQRHILTSAAKMLRPGGTLVYSTCTFSKDENEKNIEVFLSSHDDFELLETHTLYPHKVKGEGHYAAKLCKRGDGGRLLRPPLSDKADDRLYRAFERENLKTSLSGVFLAFGDNLYLMPPLFGDIKNIRLTLPALHLGEIRKNRFEPSHHLCLALSKDDFALTYEADEKELADYFKGGVIQKELKGSWGALLYKSFPVGWFKAAGGVLKNHYPKNLRDIK